MKIAFRIMLLVGLLCTGLSVAAQQPVLSYTLSVNADDTSSVQITMRMRNLPETFHLAMVKHFLVDDGYWRYVEDLQIAPGTIVREQDGLWRVSGAGSDATVRYNIRLGEKGASRVVRKPFLTPTGGLLGDLHMFMYVVEAPQAPARVLLQLPTDWSIATSLTPTSDSHIFYTRNAKDLSDSPILVGKLREWHFMVDQTPIRVAYWPLPDARPFDEKPMLDGLKKIVQGAADIFGGLPWREYLFQIRDGADEEGFEHADSVTLGVPSAALAAKRNADYVMIAHEFFHAWNMMRIHSADYSGPDYKPVELSELWFSEGMTMYYADLLVRRAGLPTAEPTRLAHLEQLIDSYLASPENARYSAEQASRGAFKPPIGDAHTDRWLLWTQSELLAAMLDLSIRDATGGKRSLDDLMRAMYANFPGERGFTTMDVERLAGEVSGRSLKPFFDAYVSGAGKIDFDQFLRLAGLKMEFQRKRATTPEGTLLPDRRVYVMLSNGESFLKLYFDDPNSGWLRAGLLNGDQLLKFNGSVVETESDFNGRLEALHVRDLVKLEVMRAGTMRQVTVAIESFDSPDVKIRELADTSNRQKAIFAKWNAGQ